MIPVPTRILLATAPADFRNSIEGLAALVETQLREPPLSGTLFVFRNRSGNSLKLLYWSNGGFILIYKKLERGRFHFPTTQADRQTLTPAEIAAILAQTQHSCHQESCSKNKAHSYIIPHTSIEIISEKP